MQSFKIGFFLVGTVLCSSLVFSSDRYEPHYTRTVTSGGITYYIDSDGTIKEKTEIKQKVSVTSVCNLKNGDSILFHKNNLIVLTGNKVSGLASLFTGKGEVMLCQGNDRTKLGSNAKQVLSDGRDLVALDHNGRLWEYNGAPAPVDYDLDLPGQRYQQHVGPNMVQDDSFHPTGLENVKSIAMNEKNDDILVVLKDGTSIQYSILKALGFPSKASEISRLIDAKSGASPLSLNKVKKPSSAPAVSVEENAPLQKAEIAK